MFGWLRKNIRKRERKADREILWPAFLEFSLSHKRAKEAFLHHALNDSAWTEDLTPEEIVDEVLKLPIGD